MDGLKEAIFEDLPNERQKDESEFFGLPEGVRESLIEMMIQNCAVAMFVIDRNHHVICWNKSCEELTGIRAGDVIGTRDHWKAFYDHQRPCLSDLLLEGKKQQCAQYYDKYGDSVLVPNGLHAEGWYSDLGGSTRYIIFDAAPILNRAGEMVAVTETLQDITARKRMEEEREILVRELQEAVAKIKTLRGLIPICSRCKKIRDDQGYWNKLENYIEEHSRAEFTHSVCPDCEKHMFPDPHPSSVPRLFRSMSVPNSEED